MSVFGRRHDGKVADKGKKGRDELIKTMRYTVDDNARMMTNVGPVWT